MADPAKPKRSLFKRPKWAAQTTPVDTATAATASPTPDSKPEARSHLFSRSHNYTEFVEDRERQRRKKKDKDERRTSDTKDAIVLDDHESPRPEKRRRISDHEDQAKSKSKSREKSRPISLDQDDLYSAPTPPRRAQSTVIELDDDSEDDDFTPTQPGAESTFDTAADTPAAEVDPDADLDDLYSDPEMLELAKTARRKRRREEREQTEANDPIVKLFITSPLPDTSPLIVQRKLSQRLQEVREAWVAKQTALAPDVAKNLFFTYKLRRVYDVTTCRSLGVKVDPFGKVISDQPFAYTDEHAEKIHIEAMNEEFLERAKAEKAAPKPNKYLANVNKDAADSTEGTPTVEDDVKAQEPLIKVTLKAKGHADIKIKVRPSTTFGKMVYAATTQFKLSADRKVHLEFDGERLEPPEGQVKDTDISDLDCIDVHIK